MERDKERADPVQDGLKGLSGEPDQEFDLVAEMIRSAAQVPLAVIHMLAPPQQWRSVSSHAWTPPSPEVARLCAEMAAHSGAAAIGDLDPGKPDAAREDAEIRACVGAPVLVDGHPVGAICALDRRSRVFDAGLQRQMALFAALVAELFERRRKAALLSDLFDGAADAVIAVDQSQRITHWNAAARALFGYTEREALGQQLRMIIPDRFRAAHDEGFSRMCATGEARRASTVEVPALRRDGTEFQADLSVSVCRKGPTAIVAAIIRDVTDRNALAQARNANRAKSRFLAHMSHEIRTPLNGILGLGHVLARTQLDNQQRGLLDTINGAAKTLQIMLTDVLDLARLDAGAMAVVSEPFDLAALIEEVGALHQPAAQSKGLDFGWERLPPTFVLGDAVRLKQLLGALLSNAVKFTARGAVRLTARAQAGQWRFEVVDTGIGFDPGAATKIFERFVQADDSITRAYGGSGLGLSLALEIARALGGDLQATGKPGEGSVFVAQIPLSPAPGAVQAMAPGAAGAGRSARILLAEDHPVNRQVVKMILDPLGLELEAVENGQLALEAFQARSYDLVLMDIQMPVMDGLTATRRIREREERMGQGRCPIIMLTANVLPEHLLASFEAGADEHLSKPVDPATLIRTVLAAIAEA